MGSLSRMRAGNRVWSALEQRLETCESVKEEKEVYEYAVGKLIKIGIDSEELNRVARELAPDPRQIEPPLPE